MKKNILIKEFTSAPEDSFNGLIAELIQLVRHNRENLSLDEFEKNIPEIKILEKAINDINSQLGDDREPYIEMIMDALSEEEDTALELVDIMKTSICDTAKYKWEIDINQEDIDITTTKFRSTYFVELSIFSSNLSDVQIEFLESISIQIATSYDYIFLPEEAD
ncbi:MULTISPECIES: hypothetical protein [unclassified Sphingobacterium]|uniref:hypothetical protein n=1 Tax=unclassified Sphingobacterium TaxID=2609468 RepID=UPI0025E490CA|nr:MULTISPECIES: hypothetical protein [unclassified Sphingobacterium]